MPPHIAEYFARWAAREKADQVEAAKIAGMADDDAIEWAADFTHRLHAGQVMPADFLGE